MTTTTKKIGFRKGDKVEVTNHEKGFEGSYYEAKVLSKDHDLIYRVEYKNLVDEEYPSEPLVECVFTPELRPLPPKSAAGATRVFSPLQKVDAFHNDGWWTGQIIGKTKLKYFVYFETTRETIKYYPSQLRDYLEWRNGTWVSSNSKN